MDIKKVKPNPNGRHRQGYYKINNPLKYVGDPTKIRYLSSYEYRFCKYCDDTDTVIKWSSEPIGIKYFHPILQKEREYFVDFYARIKKYDKEQDYLIEVKPEGSLERPIMESGSQTIRRLQNYNYAMKMWLENKAKFIAAKRFAEMHGYKFVLITEKFLFDNK